MLWTHNDRGDKSRIFLIDSLGRHKTTVTLEGVANRDWEDIAVGPGPDSGKTYIYIGEIGDNYRQYEFKFVYRIEEPRFDGTKSKVGEIDSIKFVLPDGIRDCEALMIDPHKKDLYIFSKREHAVNLYKLPYPQSTTRVLTAEKIMELPFSQIVAADWSADGKEILIKDYRNVYYWSKANHEPLEMLLQTPAKNLPYVPETQGESITFDRGGHGYYTLSEEEKGRKSRLIFYPRNVTGKKSKN
jgi:hypothetical protein